jgi:hypothetical protein
MEHRFAPIWRLAIGLLLLAGSAGTVAAALCDSTSKGYRPLTELGDSTYQSYEGGLYPGGVNTPPAGHLAAGLELADTITPLDTLGVTSPGGRIVLLSVGMSNATQEYSTFIPLALASGLKNPRVQLIDGAQGGQTAAVFANPNANAWTVIDNRLRNAGAHPAQVQAVWLKEANAQPTQGFPGAAQILRDDLRAVVQNLHAKFPNLKLCYLSSRIFGGYASTPLNPEPYAYESGFAVRWLIEEQIAGAPALNHDPLHGPVMAPWLAWGPYLWADGLVPRVADGLTWECADFAASDGTHPAASGRTKVARMLLDFFVSDPTTEPWFSAANVATGGAPAPGNALRIALLGPNPVRSGTQLVARVDAGRATRARFDLVTVDGRVVRRLPEVALAAGRNHVRLGDLSDGGRLPAGGVYFLRASGQGGLRAARSFVLVP